MATPRPTSSSSVRFDDFEINLSTGQLSRFGQSIPLQDQPFQILRLLLEAAPELVTREEIGTTLWPSDTFVDFELGINTAVRKLRHALDDSVENPRYVQTLAKRGYRFIAPIEWIGKPTPSLSAQPFSVPELVTTRRRSGDKGSGARNLRLAGLLLIALAVVLTTIPARRRQSSADNASRQQLRSEQRLGELQGLKESPITSLPGNVLAPTYSPDGSQIAFAWDGGKASADFDLYVQAIGTLEPRRLTSTPTQALSAAWSPDGRSIAFMRVGPSTTGIYLIPSTGGTERKLTTVGDLYWFGNNLSWSPDEKHLAYIDHDPRSSNADSLQVFMLELETLKSTRVSVNCSSANVPSFSPSGEFLAWICSDLTASIFSVRLYDMRNHSTSELVSRRDGIAGIGWSRGSDRLIYSYDLGEIWEISLSEKLPIRLPAGHDATDIATSTANSQIAYVKGGQTENIWKLDLSGKVPRHEPVIASSRSQLAPELSPDGTHLVYQSIRSGPFEVWVCKSDGSENLQLSSFGISMTGTPRWSPDGQHIAFDSRIEGHAEVYVTELIGGNPRKLETNIHANSMPSWSRDLKWIYFTYDTHGGPSVWKAPAQGGPAIMVAAIPATYALESPDGRFVYFSRNRRLWRADTDGRNAEQVPGMPGLIYLEDEWVIANNGIYFLWHENRNVELRFFDLQRRTIRKVDSLGKDNLGWIGSLALSSDGKTLYYPHVDQQTSDLVAIDGWR